MEPRRFPGKNQWYHETQTRRCPGDAKPLVPDAATVTDRFLLDVKLCRTLRLAQQRWLNPARTLCHYLLPDDVMPDNTVTLCGYDRLSTALTVAQVYGVQRLCNHYAARLAPQPGPDASRESNRRLTQITQYARQLAATPWLIDVSCCAQLEEVGLTSRDIVTFVNIIGFIGYQARMVAVMQAYDSQPVRWLPGMENQADAPAERFSAFAPGESTVAPTAHEATAPAGNSAHHPESLAHCFFQDKVAFNALIGLANSAPAADDAALVSLLSARASGSGGCFYRCAGDCDDATLPGAVQAGDAALAAWSIDQPRQRAVVQTAQLLIRCPGRFGHDALASMHDIGISPNDAARLLHWVALCGWLNRLRIGLDISL